MSDAAEVFDESEDDAGDRCYRLRRILARLLDHYLTPFSHILGVGYHACLSM